MPDGMLPSLSWGARRWLSAFRCASDPDSVAKHKFYPFIEYKKRWNRFAQKGEIGKEKSRVLRYAARLDSCIYSRYRHILSEQFEVLLKKHALENSVVAYRRIPISGGRVGKCNINIAHDAFTEISRLGNCTVIALDINKFFDSLDHGKLKSIWCRLIGESKLPKDHFQVFKNVTQYACVSKLEAFERLGIFGPKRPGSNGKMIPGYLAPLSQMKKQLCFGAEFQDKIAGGSSGPSIITQNSKPYGIPQGSPISDVLANAYLFDFDCELRSRVTKVGGTYLRYSDDILIILPGRDKREATRWVTRVSI